MKKTTKKNLLKRIVMAGLVCGNILSCDQAWADAVNITIDSPTSVTPTDYGGGYNADDGIIWGISGSQTIGSNVINSVATVDGGVAATVYGITLDGGKTISVGSLSGGITIEANGDAKGAFGIGASVGEITIQELGNISATALGNEGMAVGIGNESYNNSGCSTANITFADGANITVSASSYAFGIYNSAEEGGALFDTSYSNIGNINVTSAGYAYGYNFSSDNNSSSAELNFAEGKTVTVSSDGVAYGLCLEGLGTVDITKLGGITAETTGYEPAYGIYVVNKNEDSKKFVVEFATNDAKTIGGTISAYSASGNNYGIMFTDSSAGTSEITGVKSITAGFKSDSPTTVTSGSSAGIFAAKGDNSVVFTGANSSIEAKAAEYGAAIGIMYNGTGSTLITGLGSITAEETSNSYVFGIYVGNHNTDSKKFVVKFATNDAKTVGGTISAYSASGENYGIMFANDSVGTSEITGVKSITAGVKPDSPTTVTSENSAGIYANNGNNSVEFVNNSGIDVKSQSSAYGICTVGGTLDVTGLGGITVAGTGNSAKLGFAGGTLNLINSTVAETEGVTTIGGYYGSLVLNLTNSKVSGPLIMSYGTLDVNITDANSKLSITEAHFGADTGLNTNSSDKVSIDKLYIEGNGVTIDSVTSAKGAKYYFVIDENINTDSSMLTLTAGLDVTKDKFTVGIDSTCELDADESVVLLDYSSALSGLDVTNLCPKGTVSVNNDGNLVFTLGNEPLVIDVIPDDSASSNTVVVGDNTHANTAVVNGDEQTSDAVNWRDVYGGKAETGDANGNTVTVQGIADVKGNIYGGYSGDGSANNNKVEIKGGRFSDTIDIYGGRAVLGDANNNTVTIRDGRFDDVYGGYIYEGNGNAQNNTVKISGGEEFEKVCGGYIRKGTGNAQYNTVTITGGGTFEDSIWGGRASSGNAQHNTVTISGGNFTDEIYGGYVDVDSGNAQNNTVKISGGSFTDEIYGGYVDDGSGSVQNNIITISGGSFTDEIYGGYIDGEGGSVQNNIITISGGSFTDEIYGGYTDNEGGSLINNTVIINGGTFMEETTVYGGSGECYGALSNNVTINGGTYNGETYVYGGSGNTALNNSVIIDNGTFDGLTTVLGSSGNAACSNNVTINGSTYNGETTVYGGGGYRALSNNVTIGGGTYNGKLYVYGGNVNETASYNSVVIDGGTFDGQTAVNGGSGETASYNSVVIDGGTFMGETTVYGGSGEKVLGNSVVINGGTYNDKLYVYGGDGTSSSNVVKHNTVVVNKGQIEYVCGGSGVDNSVQSNVVTINGGTVKDITGGYSSGSGGVDVNILIINGGTINGTIYGGSSDNGNVYSNVVAIYGGKINGPINAGVSTGYVYGNVVHISTNDALSNSNVINAGGEFSTLVVDSSNIAVGEINEFNDYVFAVPAGISDSTPMLKNANPIAFDGSTNTIKISVDRNMAENSTVILVDKASGTVPTGSNFAYVLVEGNTVTGGGVSINGDNQLVYTMGAVTQWLNVQPGAFSNNQVKVTGNQTATVNGVDHNFMAGDSGKTTWQNVCGGYSGGEIVKGNIVTLTAGTVEGDVVGGYSGFADGNKVIMQGGTVKGSIFGALPFIGNGYFTNNSVEITGGKVDPSGSGKMIAGNCIENYFSLSDNNSVLISGTAEIGNLDYEMSIFGGYTGPSGYTCFNSSVEISGNATLININTIGNWGKDGANRNKIKITGGTINGADGGLTICGGNSDGDVTNNIVEIGGTANLTNVSVIGHQANNSSNVIGNTIKITGGTINGVDDGLTIYGGVNSQEGNVINNTVEIGGEDEPTLTKVRDIGSTSFNGAVTGNKIKISSGNIEGVESGMTICGGAGASSSAVINNVVEIGGTANLTNVGYVQHCSLYGNIIGNTVRITGGTISGISGEDDGMRIYGGYSRGDNAQVTNNTVEIACDNITNVKEIVGGTVHNSGGYTLAANNNTVSISKGTYSGTIIAGAVMGSSSASAYNNKVIITGGTFSDVTLYGGNASYTGGNTLEIGTKNVDANEVGYFQNYTFNVTGMRNENEMLSVTNALTLNDETVNITNYADSRLLKDETITLIKNVEGTFTTITTDDYTVSLSGTNLILTALTATAVFDVLPTALTGNNVVVDTSTTASNNGTAMKDCTEDAWQNAYGGYSDSTTAEDVTGNSITITGTANITGNVYGGYSKAGNATSNTVIWESGTIGGALYGGNGDDTNKDFKTGNTLVIKGKDKTIESVNNFQNYTFNIPAEIATDGSEAMLAITGDTALSFSTTDVFTVDVTHVAGTLEIANTITLLDSAQAITTFGNITDTNKKFLNGGQNWAEGRIDVSNDNKQIMLTFIGIKYVDVIGGAATGNTVTVASVKEATIENGGITTTVKFNDGEGKSTSQDGPWQNVYGSWANSGDAGNNAVNIQGGTITDNVCGGYSVTGNATGNTVTWESGTIGGALYGGNGDDINKDFKTGNTLVIKGSGKEIKSVNNFQNYEFDLTGVTADDIMLNITGDKALTFDNGDKISVKVGDMAEGDTITLLEEATGTFVWDDLLANVTFVTDITDWDATDVAEYFKVATDGKSITFTNAVLDVDIKPVNKTSGNIVTVTGDRTGTVEGETIKTPKAGRNWKNVYGGYAENGDANDNKVTITAGTIKGNVYGGYSKTDNATGNFVTWESGTIGGELYGGYSGAAGKDVGNNWLKIVHKGETKTIKALNNFSSYVFDINAAKNNDTVLKITEKEITLLGGEYTVVVMDEQNEALRYEGTVCLIEDVKGIVDAGVTSNATETSDGIVTTYGRYTIEDGKKLIYTKTSKMEADDGAKAPVEGMASAATTVNTSSDLATGAGMGSMIVSTSATNNADTFGATNIGKARYNTGSHVDASGYGIVVGVGKKVFDKKGNKTTGGLFFEYGNSNFDTYNTNTIGSGKSIYKGGGYMMRWDNLSGNYYEGMIHAGKITTNWSNNSGGYNMNPTYYGAAATYGHKFMFGEKNQLSVYGSYIYSHTGGGDAMIGKYNYNFDATKSHRTKVGVRYAVSDLMDTKKFRPYVGLAWEHEFNGESGASVVGFGRTAAPSMKGDTGILELGFKQEVGKWTLGIGAEVFTGKRRGWSGTLQAMYNF